MGISIPVKAEVAVVKQPEVTERGIDDLYDDDGMSYQPAAPAAEPEPATDGEPEPESTTDGESEPAAEGEPAAEAEPEPAAG